MNADVSVPLAPLTARLYRQLPALLLSPTPPPPSEAEEEADGGGRREPPWT